MTMPLLTPKLAAAMLLAAGVLAAAPVADAASGPRVAVTPFAGPGVIARQAHAAVAAIVAEDHEIVSSADILIAGARSGGDVRLVETAMNVARLTGADAIVLGRVAESGDGYKLAISIRQARSGRSVGAVLVPLFSTTLVAADSARIRPFVLELLAQVDGDASPRALDELTDELADEVPDAIRGGATKEVGETLPVDIEVGAGLMMSSRRLRFREEPGASSGASLEARPTAGFVLDAAVSTHGRRRAGLAFHLDRAIGARLAFGAPGEQLALPVTQMRWSVATMGAVSWRRFELSGRLGYSSYTYAVSLRPERLRTPDASYGSFEAGLGLSVALPRRLHAFAGARYLHVVKSDGITDVERFGSARSRGRDIDGGLAYDISASVAVRVGVRHSRLGLRFNGDGLQASELDDDDGQDVSSAVDSLVAVFGQVSLRL